MQAIFLKFESQLISQHYSKTDPLINYKPVSLTCIVSKIYEKIIKSSIIQFIENKVNKHQNGFIKGISCLTNLLKTMDCIIDIIDQGDPVDIFYFDFKKAFDRVPTKDYSINLNP